MPKSIIDFAENFAELVILMKYKDVLMNKNSDDVFNDDLVGRILSWSENCKKSQNELNRLTRLKQKKKLLS